MLALSDDELRAVMSAAAPLPPHQRDAFLRDVAAELAKHLEIGPGVIGRVCSRLQREHINRPRYRNGVSKWR
jgi:hypothetical protein